MMIETIKALVFVEPTTRVVKRMTTDLTSIPLDGEVSIETVIPRIVTKTDVSTGLTTYWVTDDGNLIEADEAQKADAFMVQGVRYWVVNKDGAKRAATEEEVDASRIDPEREAVKRDVKYQTYVAVVKDLSTNDAVSKELQGFFVALLETL